MARYIDVGKLLKELTISPDGTKIPNVDCDNFPTKIDLRLLKRIILRQPAADVVEVVRCEKCKWYIAESMRCGNPFGLSSERVEPTQFCSYGERRDT